MKILKSVRGKRAANKDHKSLIETFAEKKSAFIKKRKYFQCLKKKLKNEIKSIEYFFVLNFRKGG